MRVTEGMMTDAYLYNYKKIVKKETQLQLQLATNSKINTLSDDVNGALQSIKVEMQIKKTDTYIKNVQNAQSFTTATLNSLDNMVTEIQKIITTVTSAQNALNTENFPTMLQSVKDSLAAIVNDINAKNNNMYLFGGTNYTEQPVTLDANGKAVATTTDISGDVNSQVSQNVNMSINVPGSDIINTGALDSINDIIDSFAAGNAPTQTQIDSLQTSYNNILNIQSITGERSNRLDDISSLLSNQKQNLQTMLQNIAGIDAAQVSVDLQSQDYLLQVAQKVLAQTYPKSILDYL